MLSAYAQCFRCRVARQVVPIMNVHFIHVDPQDFQDPQDGIRCAAWNGDEDAPHATPHTQPASQAIIELGMRFFYALRLQRWTTLAAYLGALEPCAVALPREWTPRDPNRLSAILAALEPYRAGQALPGGVPDEAVGLLFFTLFVPGLWGQLDERDRRIGTLLLAYYTTDQGMADLVALAEGVTDDRVGQLIRQGVDVLWDGLPSTPTALLPFEKEQVFPKAALQNIGRTKRRAAARARWTDEAARQKQLAAIQVGSATDEERARKSAAVTARWDDPEAKERLIRGMREGWARRRDGERR